MPQSAQRDWFKSGDRWQQLKETKDIFWNDGKWQNQGCTGKPWENCVWECRLTFITFPSYLFSSCCQALGHLGFAAHTLWYHLFGNRSTRKDWSDNFPKTHHHLITWPWHWFWTMSAIRCVANEAQPPTWPWRTHTRIWRSIFRLEDSCSCSSELSWCQT